MVQRTFFDFVREQMTTPLPVAEADLTGKTVVVIGANVGLGFEASKHFARMNPGRLILACRNQAKGNEAIASLEQETGYSRAELWIIDLSEFSSVKSFVDKFEQDGVRLDILVENAAIAAMSYKPTPDGWESNLQVNYLALSLLALLLLPRMIQTAKEHSTTPRLVIVSSNLHYAVSFDSMVESPKILSTLGSEEHSTPRDMAIRYHITKLLNVFFVRSLNARLPSSSPTITVNAVNPGYCLSELRREVQGIRFWVMDKVLALTAEQGSRQLVYAAVAGEEESMRGAYVSCSKVMEVSDYALSEEGAKAEKRIWDEMVEILATICPRVQKTIDDYLTASGV